MSAREDYPGQLDMLRGLVAGLHAVAEHGNLGDVRKLLEEHRRDEEAAVADSARERRLAQLLDTIRTHGGRWSTGRLQDLRRLTGGPVQRGTSRRDLAELHRRGHLIEHGPQDSRFYTLKTSKDV